ncbi:MAG: Ty1/Copia family ribonuclease HI, partial [Candidatus Saccharimonadales bacterium]
MALSTTEAEYMAAVEAGKEIIWMRNLLKEIGAEVDGPSELRMDNQSAMCVAKNPEHHGRMKHIDLRCHWLREVVEDGTIIPTYVPTSHMPADLLTKPLSKGLVEGFRNQMGLK